MKKHGFTLIELLVVISIISLLSSIVLSSLNSARQKANNTKKKQELSQLLRALNTYYLDTNSMPVNATPGFWCTIGTVYAGGTCFNEVKTAGYISTLPTSPDSNVYYYYDYGTYALVGSRLTPAVYGSGWRGWHCSDSTGGATDKIYCLEFDK